MVQKGYLYVAAGDKYIQEATISAKSLRQVDKDADITLVADREVNSDLLNLFNDIKIRSCIQTPLERKAFRAKSVYDDSPYQKTFHIDTDTYFYENCQALFELLDYFDICMTAGNRTTDVYINEQLLRGYASYNAGFFLYRKNSKTEYLFHEWRRNYEKKIREGFTRPEGDQASFMRALLKSEVRVHILPHVWNTRLPFYNVLNDSVKIIHGRSDDFEKLRLKLNESTSHRCWDPVHQRCLYRKPSTLSKIKKYFQNILAPDQSK